MTKRVLGVLLLALTSSAFSQPIAQANGWAKIANEGDAVTSGPASIQVQACGSAAACTPVVTITSYPFTATWADGASGGVFGPDPAPGIAKSIGVLQAAAQQTFSVTSLATSVSALVTVAALPVPVSTGTWQQVCPAGCHVVSVVGPIPTSKYGWSGVSFNSTAYANRTTLPLFVLQDGKNTYTFTWTTDFDNTRQQTVIALTGPPAVTQLSACIYFTLLAPYKTIICGPVLDQLPGMVPAPSAQ